MKVKNILFTLSSACLLSVLVSKDVVIADEEIKTDTVHTEMVNGGYALPINELYIDDNKVFDKEYSKRIEDVLKEMYLKQNNDGKIVLFGTIPANMELLLVDEANKESVKLDIDDTGYFEVGYSKLSEYKTIKLVKTDSDIEEDSDELVIDINQLDVLLQELKETQKESEEEPEPEQASEEAELEKEEPEQEEPKQEKPRQEEPRQEESKKVETEQEESKQEEPKQEEPILNKNSEPAKKNEEQLKIPEAKEKSMLASSPLSRMQIKRTAKDGIYTVVKGDNFNAIAKDFNLSIIQLKVWNNNITDINNIKTGQNIVVSRKGYESTLSKAEKAKLSVATTSQFSTKQQFFDYIKPYAVKIAAAKGQEELYVSLMMGQAAHESNYGRSGLASPPYFNLSGVKGSYNGEYVKMWTWEEVNGEVVEVLANFRKYPSYEHALQDYASKLRNGLTYDPLNYAGTWMKNASTYEQAIKGLSSGTSKYATDSNYYAKVLNVIKENELYKHDSNYYEDIISTKNVSYDAVINRKTDTINTKPYKTKGSTYITKSASYYDRLVTVSKEAITKRATWALISIDGKEIGWVDKGSLAIYEQIKSTKNIAYSAKISRSTDTINSIAWGTAKNKVLGNTASYINQTVKITQERVTDRTTWSLISINGKEIGWVDKKALQIETVDSQKAVSYDAIIKRKTDTINTKPYGTEGYLVVSKSDKYYGDTVTITKEAVTIRATWALISVNGKEIGWIDKAAVDTYDQIRSTKDIAYSAKINRSTDTINSIAWGTANNKVMGKTASYINQTVKVTQERVTDRTTWSLISLNGKELGWVDKKALQIETVDSQKEVSYDAIIKRKTDTINTKPYGTEGYIFVSKSDKYYGETVAITKEAVTSRATWALILVDGKEIGWIDKAAIDTYDQIRSTKDITYSAKINRSTDTINSIAWGTANNTVMGKTASYINQTVKITKERVTDRATWSLVFLNGKELGWIDKAALTISKE